MQSLSACQLPFSKCCLHSPGHGVPVLLGGSSWTTVLISAGVLEMGQELDSLILVGLFQDILGSCIPKFHPFAEDGPSRDDQWEGRTSVRLMESTDGAGNLTFFFSWGICLDEEFLSLLKVVGFLPHKWLLWAFSTILACLWHWLQACVAPCHASGS